MPDGYVGVPDEHCSARLPSGINVLIVTDIRKGIIMEIAVWAVSGLIALAMGAAGTFKIITPREKLVGMQPWAEDFSRNQITLIGAVEILGAIGLILPRLLDIAPILSPIAAVGFILVHSVAISVHARRKETFVPNIVFILFAGFVATAGFLGY